MIDYTIFSRYTKKKKEENLENSSVWKHWRTSKAVRICGAKILGEKGSKGEQPNISCTSQNSCQVQKWLLLKSWTEKKKAEQSFSPMGLGRQTLELGAQPTRRDSLSSWAFVVLYSRNKHELGVDLLPQGQKPIFKSSIWWH